MAAIHKHAGLSSIDGGAQRGADGCGAASADLVRPCRLGEKLDQQSLARYQSVSGNAEDVVMLLNMTRSFMRGLLIQEQYGVTAATTLNYVRKWIELIAPLLKLSEQSVSR